MATALRSTDPSLLVHHWPETSDNQPIFDSKLFLWIPHENQANKCIIPLKQVKKRRLLPKDLFEEIFVKK